MIRILSSGLIVVFFVWMGCGEDPTTGRLYGTVSLQADIFPPPAGDLKGTVYIGVIPIAMESTFEPAAIGSVEADFGTGPATYEIKDIPPGDYVVSGFLDDNGNVDPKQSLPMPDAQDVWNPLAAPITIAAGEDLQFNLLLDTPISSEEPYCGDEPLDSAERRCVFDFIWNLADRTFPFFMLRSVDWDQVKLNYESLIDQPADDAEFRLLMTEYMAQLRDAHSQVAAKSWMPDLGLYAIVSGVKFSWVTGNVYVVSIEADSDAALKGLKVGDRILRVNGLTLEEYVQSMGKYIPRPNDPYYYYSLVHNYWLAGNVGEQNPAQVEIERDNLKLSINRSIAVGNIGSLIISQRLTGTSGKEYGYIWISTFLGDYPDLIPKFNEALDGLLDVDGLIIDVRENSGGLATVASPMFARLIDQPVPIERNYFRGNSTDYVVTRVTPGQNPYLGPLMVLIDESCYSMGHMFPAELKDIGRAKLVGRATGGGNGTPEPWKLTSNLKLSISTKYCATGSGTMDELNGVQPDVEVIQTVADIQNGLYSERGNPDHDIVLKRAIEELGN